MAAKTIRTWILGKAIFVPIGADKKLYSCGEETWCPFLTEEKLKLFGAKLKIIEEK